jgi:uncharacterized protein (DUF1501 family)
MKRRTLLQLGAGFSAASLLQALSSQAGSSGGPSSGKVFVLLELKGGNDGLNTVAPVADPLYRQARPRLAVADGFDLGRGLALNPALAPLIPAWRARRLAFALGVGWPLPSRSHFKAMDQWSTGQASGEGPGWLAAALRAKGSPGPLLALGTTGSAALEGADVLSIQLSPAQLQDGSTFDLNPASAGSNPLLRRMLDLEAAGSRELQILRQALRPLPRGVAIPRGPLGQQVGLALRLLATGLAPPVLQLSQVGFDTHTNQLQRHGLLLKELAEALAAFDAGLQRLADRPQVTLLAQSEFGRRFSENGSAGTDHGTASVAILLGDHVPHPFLGTHPSLSRLDSRGDLMAGLSPPVLYQNALAL